jgi:hypothetical protein
MVLTYSRTWAGYKLAGVVIFVGFTVRVVGDGGQSIFVDLLAGFVVLIEAFLLHLLPPLVQLLHHGSLFVVLVSAKPRGQGQGSTKGMAQGQMDSTHLNGLIRITGRHVILAAQVWLFDVVYPEPTGLSILSSF